MTQRKDAHETILTGRWSNLQRLWLDLTVRSDGDSAHDSAATAGGEGHRRPSALLLKFVFNRISFAWPCCTCNMALRS